MHMIHAKEHTDSHHDKCYYTLQLLSATMHLLRSLSYGNMHLADEYIYLSQHVDRTGISPRAPCKYSRSSNNRWAVELTLSTIPRPRAPKTLHLPFSPLRAERLGRRARAELVGTNMSPSMTRRKSAQNSHFNMAKRDAFAMPLGCLSGSRATIPHLYMYIPTASSGR